MQVVVIGCGPGGMLAAAACADAGLPVLVVAPDLDVVWPNRYGVFCDELESVGLGHVLAERWPDVAIELDLDASGAPLRTLQRPYARVDGDKLREDCWRRVHLAGGQGRRGQVASIETLSASTDTGEPALRCHLQDGTALAAWVVIDARGAAGANAEAEPSVEAWQAAWGELATAEGPGAAALAEGPMVLMGWSPPDAASRADWLAQPSFLYAQPLGDGRVFVEETVLSARTPLSFDQLRDRLARRMARMGVQLRQVEHVERCLLPMLMQPAPASAGVLPWGARAGAIHPATGYLVGYLAQQAPRLAASLVASARAGSSGVQAAIAAQSSLCPPEMLHRDTLLRFGGELLVDMDGPAIVRFFAAFFALTPTQGAVLLSRRGGVRALAMTMLRVFWAAPASIQQRLGRAGWQARRTLLPALWGAQRQPQESP